MKFLNVLVALVAAIGMAIPASANAKLKDPDEVAEAVMHFIASDTPRMRYMVPPTENAAQIAIRTTLGRVVQLNAGQPYEMSRDELVAVLDEILAEQGQIQTASD